MTIGRGIHSPQDHLRERTQIKMGAADLSTELFLVRNRGKITLMIPVHTER